MTPRNAAGKKNVGFSDRLSTAAAAKEAELKRARAKTDLNDPAFAERQAARWAATSAREAREQERKAAQKALAQQVAAEKLARAADEVRQAAEKAAQDAVDLADAETRAIELAAQKKAERDARYAARKNRK